MAEKKDELQAVNTKFPVSMIKKIDAWGKRKAMVKRSDMVRALVAKGLDLDPGPGKMPSWVEKVQEMVAAYPEIEGDPAEVIEKIIAMRERDVHDGPVLVKEPAPAKGWAIPGLGRVGGGK
jgi:hypothetical protein